jgi:holo-[acyl-carrier protein] synthase
MGPQVSTRVLGLGLDFVEVERFDAVLKRQGEKFVQRVFTESEQSYCSNKSTPAMFYAARFAAKEAVAKAFGTGIGAELGWLDIEIAHHPSGAPLVQLLGKARQLASKRGVTEVLISLTHTEVTAGASVVLQ